MCITELSHQHYGGSSLASRYFLPNEPRFTRGNRRCKSQTEPSFPSLSFLVYQRNPTPPQPIRTQFPISEPRCAPEKTLAIRRSPQTQRAAARSLPGDGDPRRCEQQPWTEQTGSRRARRGVRQARSLRGAGIPPAIYFGRGHVTLVGPYNVGTDNYNQRLIIKNRPIQVRRDMGGRTATFGGTG